LLLLAESIYWFEFGARKFTNEINKPVINDERTGLEFIEIYDEMLRHGHIQDQYSFDRWIGKSCGYTAYLRTTGSSPSIQTLMHLYFRLLAADQAHAVYDVDTGELRVLAKSVMDEIKRRCS